MAGKKEKDEKEEAPLPEKAERLTLEVHPIFGKIERWRMSDGTVETFTIPKEE